MKKYLLATLLMVMASGAQAATQDLINNVKNNDIAAVKNLLAAGENVNGMNEQGNTALHYAIAMDNAEMTKLLLNHGANMNAINDKGWTPLKIAEKKNVKNVTAVLVEELQKEQAEAHRIAVAQAQEKARAQALAHAEVQAAKNKLENEMKAGDAADKKAVMSAQERAEIAALEAKKAQEKAELALAKAEKALKALEEKNAATAKTAVKSVAKPSASVKAPVKPAPKAVKPAPKKPAPKVVIPQKSSLFSGLMAGDEEIVYCLNLLGHGENQDMLKASGFYAADAGIGEPRFRQIEDMVMQNLSTVDEARLKQMIGLCGKVITPADANKQNQIIRSMNRVLAY